jgi:hypothetical protein
MFVFKQIPADLDQFTGDMVLAVVGEDERPLKAANSWLDWRLYGSISQLLIQGLFTGRLGEKCLLPTYGKFKFDRLILVGGGNLFDDSVYPTAESGSTRWMEISDVIHRTIQSLRVEKIGLSLPRFDLQDHERALLKTLQSTRLPTGTSLFLSRASTYSASF